MEGSFEMYNQQVAMTELKSIWRDRLLPLALTDSQFPGRMELHTTLDHSVHIGKQRDSYVCSPWVIKILDLWRLILWSSYYLPGLVLKYYTCIIILLFKNLKVRIITFLFCRIMNNSDRLSYLSNSRQLVNEDKRLQLMRRQATCSVKLSNVLESEHESRPMWV